MYKPTSPSNTSRTRVTENRYIRYCFSLAKYCRNQQQAQGEEEIHGLIVGRDDRSFGSKKKMISIRFNVAKILFWLLIFVSQVHSDTIDSAAAEYKYSQDVKGVVAIVVDSNIQIDKKGKLKKSIATLYNPYSHSSEKKSRLSLTFEQY